MIFRTFLVFLWVVLGFNGAAVAQSPGPVIIHGGGIVYTFTSSGSYSLTRSFAAAFKEGGGRRADIVVINSDEHDEVTDLPYILRKAGYRRAQQVTMDMPNAEALILGADVVYFDGGVQTRLTRKLNRHPRILAAIRQAHQNGAVLGGVSAGAAVMSRVMICCDRDGKAILSQGLGILANVVVDQHYRSRNREFRLRQALAQHPELVGLGLDNGVAVIIRGNSVETVADRRNGAATLVTIHNLRITETNYRHRKSFDFPR